MCASTRDTLNFTLNKGNKIVETLLQQLFVIFVLIGKTEYLSSIPMDQ